MSNLLNQEMAAEDASPSASATLAAALGRSERAAAINSRIENLPASRWHIKVRMIMGTATFFDAFDALSIAAALPVLMFAWHLSPAQAGVLIASGYVGQLVGAPFFGWLAERVGRLKAAMWSVMIFSLMSLVCASAWNLHSLMLFRAIQGFGLGGEVPISATYINEMSRANTRGQFFMMYESVFMVGIILSSIAGSVIVPNFGWQYLFAICALPALLCAFLQKLVPESPRWLVSRGRLDDAEKAVARIQREIEAEGKQIPPPQTLPEIAIAPELTAHRSRSLFNGIYLSRTLSLWVLWFCIYFVAYGTLTWFPSIVKSQFGLTLQTSLYMAVGLNGLNLIALGFAAFMIDRVGRKMWFAVASLLCAAGMLVLWAFGLSTAGPASRATRQRDQHVVGLYSVSVHARALSDPQPQRGRRGGDLLGPHRRDHRALRNRRHEYRVRTSRRVSDVRRDRAGRRYHRGVLRRAHRGPGAGRYLSLNIPSGRREICNARHESDVTPKGRRVASLTVCAPSILCYVYLEPARSGTEDATRQN
jgi:putative MFS transporter